MLAASPTPKLSPACLLRAEAVASSKIEGLEVGGRRLLKAQAAMGLGDEPSDVTAVEVLNNIEAMRWAVDTLSEADAITLDHLLGIHERLLAGTFLERHAGRLRDEQNWIGGSSYNPCSAAFVPPPPERMADLLEDLCAFCNQDALPAIAQAAIAHAQFETIHPFVDGNGRTGRALIHVILRRRGLAPIVVPPVSLVLATWSQDYISGLTATRPRPGEQNGTDAWIALFAAAMTRAVRDAESYEDRVDEVQAAWRERLGRVRSDSAAAKLISALPGAPVVTAQSAATLIGRSFQAVNEAIPRLVCRRHPQSDGRSVGATAHSRLQSCSTPSTTSNANSRARRGTLGTLAPRGGCRTDAEPTEDLGSSCASACADAKPHVRVGPCPRPCRSATSMTMSTRAWSDAPPRPG